MTTTPSPDLAGLLARVEAATRPHRELDKAIALSFGWSCADSENDWRDETWTRPDGFALPIGTLANPPFFTASLDAALALCERLLPADWQWSSVPAYGASGRIGQTFGIHAVRPISDNWSTHKLPALALLAAMLKALIAANPTIEETGR